MSKNNKAVKVAVSLMGAVSIGIVIFLYLFLFQRAIIMPTVQILLPGQRLF